MKKDRRAGRGIGSRDEPLAGLARFRQRMLGEEERFTRALAACVEGILLADREGRITHANAAAERLLGTRGRSLPGSSYTDAFWRIIAVNGIASSEQGPALLLRIQNAETLAGEQLTLERPDGTRVVLGIDTAPVPDTDGDVAAMIIRVSEVEGGRPSEIAGPAADPDAIRDVVGGIANDFNNILTAIIGNISLARTEVNREDEIYKTLTYVERASMRARDLAQRLLDLARPGVATATTRETAGAPEREAIHGSGRILVMDDEEMVRHVASRMLTYLGYEVALAADGAEALAMYIEAREAGRPFRAVIMDLTVPEGMGGEETIAELIRIDPEVRAVVSTGYSTDPIMTDFSKHGFRGAVRKPYEITQLSSAVHQVLAEEIR